METRFITPLFCYDDDEEKSGFFSIPLEKISEITFIINPVL